MRETAAGFPETDDVRVLPSKCKESARAASSARHTPTRWVLEPHSCS